MRKYNLIALFLLGCFLVNFINTGFSNENLPPLIPVPKFIKTGYGTFKIDSGIQFEFNSKDEQISESGIIYLVTAKHLFLLMKFGWNEAGSY